MTQVDAVRDELQSDLGWALGAVLRAYAKGARPLLADVPGGHRGYQVLAAASAAEGTQLALANKLGVDRTVMTYLLDDLEKAGLIERVRDSQDRRVVYSQLTERGLEVIDEAIASHLDNEHRLLAGLSEDEARQLAVLLRKLEDSVVAAQLRDGETA